MTDSEIDVFVQKLIDVHGLEPSIKLMQKNLELSKQFEDDPLFQPHVRDSWIKVLGILEGRK